MNPFHFITHQAAKDQTRFLTSRRVVAALRLARMFR